MKAPHLSWRSAEKTSGGAASLPAWIYGDDEFFAFERERVLLPSWQPLCHVNDIPAPGDYHCFSFLGQSAFVVRGRDGMIRAFHNVCRHRGARLLDGDRGNCGGRITCPYHAWSYDLNGALAGVPSERQYPDLDRAQHGLAAVEHEIFLGFIFVRFRPGGPGIAEMMAPVAQEMALYRIEEMQPLGRVTLRPRSVNWKNVSDNYVDALHVPIAHPGLAALLGDNYSVEVLGDVCRLSGVIGTAGPGSWSTRAYRKWLPEVSYLPDRLRRRWLYYKVWPNFAFDIYPDQIDFMQFIPISATETLIREIPYALADGRREMKAARYLNWRINRVVNAEDKELIERVQTGMDSGAFTSGPLGESEICLRDFADRMRQLLPISRDQSPPGGGRSGPGNERSGKVS